MISTNKKKLWLKCWSLKDHGKNYMSVYHKKHKVGFRWLHDHFGSNYRMTEMQASIGREQLILLNQQIKKRNLIAKLYLNGLKKYFSKYNIFKKPNFKFQNFSPKKYNEFTHVFYRLNLFIDNKRIQQLKLIQQINKNKINCGVGSCPEIYREKIFKKLKLYPKKRLPNAKLLGETSISFPINPYRSLSSIKLEISILKKILDKFTNKLIN